jgi:hypothetical protein
MNTAGNVCIYRQGSILRTKKEKKEPQQSKTNERIKRGDEKEKKMGNLFMLLF